MQDDLDAAVTEKIGSTPPEEVRELLLKAGTRFDELFDSVPQSELKLAMEAVRRSDPRREFVKVG